MFELLFSNIIFKWAVGNMQFCQLQTAYSSFVNILQSGFFMLNY